MLQKPKNVETIVLACCLHNLLAAKKNHGRSPEELTEKRLMQTITGGQMEAGSQKILSTLCKLLEEMLEPEVLEPRETILETIISPLARFHGRTRL